MISAYFSGVTIAKFGDIADKYQIIMSMKTQMVGLAGQPVQVHKNDKNKDFADDKFDRKEMSS